ncbi:MAG: hypothetical protein FWE69_04410 [Clostridiales bacterium]|nr:hypothetical protein [Clostridiales bacterium]
MKSKIKTLDHSTPQILSEEECEIIGFYRSLSRIEKEMFYEVVFSMDKYCQIKNAGRKISRGEL